MPELINIPFIQKYISANPSLYDLESSQTLNAKFANVVVIPVFDELDFFHQTLDALLKAVNTSDDKSLILVIVNNPPLTTGMDSKKAIGNNQILLQQLRNNMFIQQESQINLAWIDASSPGHEIRKDHGVGGARKIAMDAVLTYFDWDKDPLIFSLDADTLVETNYLSASREYFNQYPHLSGAVIDFKHQKGKNPVEEKAIRIYEQYLQQYVDGLKKAKSPYAYHSVGSTIVCRASCYIKAGGMRPRTAGEDFYFLQALCKSGKPPSPIGAIKTTKVFPSARISTRVPFGTGPRIAEIVNKIKKKDSAGLHIQPTPSIGVSTGQSTSVSAPTPTWFPEYIPAGLFYNPEIFKLLENVVAGVENGRLGKSFDAWFIDLPSPAKDFFESCEFSKTWPKITKNTPQDTVKIKWAFHTWFDAFRILKFIHFCEAPPYNLSRVISGILT